MQELLKSLEKTIIQHVEHFIKRVTNKYPSTDTDTLLSLWKNESTTLVVTSPASVKSTSKISNEGSCAYISIKGKNAGKICGIKPKDGGLYCRTHKKYEGKQPREKKIIPEPKKSSSSPKQESSQRIFRKYKGLSHLYHPETNLVIKSPTDRYVIGKIVNEKIEDLTDEDIELCKQWGFPLSSKNFTEPKKVDSSNEKLTESEQEKPTKHLDSSSEKPKKSEDEKLTKPLNSSSEKPKKSEDEKPTKPKKVVDSSDDEEDEKPTTPKKVIESQKKSKKVESQKKSKKVESEKKPKKVVDSSDDEEDEKLTKSKKVIDSEKKSKIGSEKKPKKVVDSSDDEEELGKQNKSKDTEDYINDLADDTSNVIKALGLEEDE